MNRQANNYLYSLTINLRESKESRVVKRMNYRKIDSSDIAKILQKTKCYRKAVIPDKLEKWKRVDVRGSGRECPWVGRKNNV